MAAVRPNILLIHVDQHRFDALGCNGHPVVRTPNLDRLAQQGVNFTHAFTPAPVSTPARASLLTGAWPTQHGCVLNRHTEGYQPARRDLPTFTQLLNQAGYRVGHVGKFGGETAGVPTEFGMHDFVPGGGYAKWREAQGLPAPPRDAGWFGQCDVHIRPEQSFLAWGADRAIELLRQYRGHAPFFLRWDPVEPHLPCVPPEPYCSMYPPEAVPPWPSFPDELAGKPYIQAQQRRTWRIEGWTWRDWAPIVARYLGTVSLIDAQVGRVLEALDDLGVAENTLVVYSSDHGDLCGGHGMIDKHYVMYDDVARVPLILRWPAGLAAGGVCEALVTHEIDLARTFCAVAGVTPPASFAGCSLIDAALGRDPQPRDAVFGQWVGAQFGCFSQRMVRDRRWKYVWNAVAEDELYDLQCDPGEVRNLARQASASQELERLRRRLVQWMESIRDPLLNEWTRDQLLNGLKV